MDTDREATTKELLQARQWGTGVSGGAEAIAIFHLLIEDLWHNNLFQTPLAIIQVDQKSWFGQLEHLSIDEAIQQDHPTMVPMTFWKHSHPSQATQGTAGRFTQTLGAQQGDVAGSLEVSAALAEPARASRARIHQAQAHGYIPWAQQNLDGATLQAQKAEWEHTMKRRTDRLALDP